uniref:Uncharacterized protein n=1 Tax=Cacopsylla melanoneura TaxID=428564 RepID=A0A8D9AX42_9HEMI
MILYQHRFSMTISIRAMVCLIRAFSDQVIYFSNLFLNTCRCGRIISVNSALSVSMCSNSIFNNSLSLLPLFVFCSRSFVSFECGRKVWFSFTLDHCYIFVKLYLLYLLYKRPTLLLKLYLMTCLILLFRIDLTHGLRL